MAQFSAITTPHKYTYGYSAIPLRVIDTDASSIEQYKYVINILFNKLTVSSVQTVDFQGDVYTKVNFATAHKYKLGDVLFLNQTSGYYTDYYTVVSVTSSTSIIIDLNIGPALTGTTRVSNVIKYKLSPDPVGEAKVDLSNTLKDYITENLSDVNSVFNAPNTKFDYELLVGYEGQALFTFNDNYFSFGKVGFVNSGLTATTQVQFQIGDQVIINQELYSWPYYDNFFNFGKLGFTGTTNHGFSIGDTVDVTGQITAPSYNGPSTIISSTTKSITLNKPFTTSTPAEPGVIYGIVTPEYNTTATITDITYVPGTGVVVTTNVPWAGNSPIIGGTIKHADGKLLSSYNHLSITDLSAYNSYTNQLNYSRTGFDKYVVQSRNKALNNISTIYEGSNQTGTTKYAYRIERSTKSWLLSHAYTTNYSPRVAYYWYDNSNTQIGVSYLSGASAFSDYYFPVGLNQVLASTGRTDSVSLSTISGSVATYYVALAQTGTTLATNYIKFEINNDCAGYELYHLMWKDALGSWLSYPFKYISQDSMDVDRKNYYRVAGNWNNGTFGYDSFDRGEKSFFVRSRDKIKLNSGWIDDYENALIKDLMQSASVYIQYPDGKLIACTIENKEITFGKASNEQIYQYTLDVITSNNEIRL
jgi:hypothetical protein